MFGNFLKFIGVIFLLSLAAQLFGPIVWTLAIVYAAFVIATK